MAARILSPGWHSMTLTVSFTPGRFTHKPTMPFGQLAAVSGRIVQKFPETRLQQLCGFHCHAAGSDLATEHLFGSLKQQLAGCRVLVHAWLRLTRDRFLLRKGFKTRASIIQMHPCAG